MWFFPHFPGISSTAVDVFFIVAMYCAGCLFLFSPPVVVGKCGGGMSVHVEKTCTTYFSTSRHEKKNSILEELRRTLSQGK